MYYVYLIQSLKDKNFLYTGFSEDLKQRLKSHDWHMTKSNKAKAPFKLVWYSGFNNKKKAIDFEQYLKSSSGFAFRNKRLI